MNWNVALVAAAALVAFHALAVVLALRNRRPVGADRSTTVEDPTEYVDGDRVACPDCGETNEVGYRFCGNCVSELPRSVSTGRDSVPPFTRGVR